MVEILDRLSALMLSALLLATIGFAGWRSWRGDFVPVAPTSVSRKSLPCVQVENSAAKISRSTLSWLIDVPLGFDGQAVMKRLNTPYCFLFNDNTLTKAAYPCEWDPATWIIVTFQNQHYAGYDFSFNHSRVDEKL
jgi:hypothetical protein